jgi:hypothetical protein
MRFPIAGVCRSNASFPATTSPMKAKPLVEHFLRYLMRIAERLQLTSHDLMASLTGPPV